LWRLSTLGNAEGKTIMRMLQKKNIKIMIFIHFNHYWQFDYQAKGINHIRNFSVNNFSTTSTISTISNSTPKTEDGHGKSNFDETISKFKTNGGAIANLCSRTMRTRSHAESTKNAAGRVQMDSEKLANFWINQADIDPAKLSPQKRTEAEALLKKVHISHAMLLLEVQNLLNLEEVGFLKKDYPGQVDW